MKDDLICIVKVSTEAFERGGTYFYGKSLRLLKRLSNYDLLKEECDNIGIADALEQILNLNSVKDGKYQLIGCNISRDIESGYIDDWDLQLIKYEETKE